MTPSKLWLCAAASFSIALLSNSVQAASPTLETLGEAVFFDTNLSEPKGMSCATCHNPQTGFTSPVDVIEGSVKGRFGNRNIPTLFYAALTPPFHVDEEKKDDGTIEYTPAGGLFHDGRADTLAEQAEGPLTNPLEMNNPSRLAIVRKVAASAYADSFKAVFGPTIFENTDQAFSAIMATLAAFESTDRFMPFASKFDAVLTGQESFTPEEARGFALFKDPEKGNCIACHAGKTDSTNPRDWLFTDYTYDNLGLPRNNAIPANKRGIFDLGLCQHPKIKAKLPDAIAKDDLCGAFKVPTLRNIAQTAPYGHNGVFKDLHTIVAFYATRDTNPEKWYPIQQSKPQSFNDLPRRYHANVNHSEAPYDRKLKEQPRLSPQNVDDLVAFLKTLSDRSNERH